MNTPHPIQPPPTEIQLPQAFARRFRRTSPVIGITVSVGGLLIYLVLLGLASIAANGVPPAAATILGGLPTGFLLAIGVTVVAARTCLSGDRLIVQRARGVRRALVVLLAGLLITAALGALLLVLLADPATDGLLLAVALVFTALIGLLGFVSGSFFVRPTTDTLRRFGGADTVW